MHAYAVHLQASWQPTFTSSIVYDYLYTQTQRWGGPRQKKIFFKHDTTMLIMNLSVTRVVTAYLIFPPKYLALEKYI